MKAKSFLSIILITFFIATCFSQKQTDSDKKTATANQINEKVKAKDFKIEVNYAYPMQGRNISLSYGYDLTIRNDSALSYLPYYGRAYSAPYGGGDGGIKFKDVMKEYSATPKKKNGEWTIKFKMDTPDYNYEISVDIYSNGKSTLNVICPQRQPISFNGEMVLK